MLSMERNARVLMPRSLCQVAKRLQRHWEIVPRMEHLNVKKNTIFILTADFWESLVVPPVMIFLHTHCKVNLEELFSVGTLASVTGTFLRKERRKIGNDHGKSCDVRKTFWKSNKVTNVNTHTDTQWCSPAPEDGSGLTLAWFSELSPDNSFFYITMITVHFHNYNGLYTLHAYWLFTVLPTQFIL